VDVKGKTVFVGQAVWAIQAHTIGSVAGRNSLSWRWNLLPAYEKYGISVELVERIKIKMKDPAMKERVKTMLGNVSKKDLQDRAAVNSLLGLTSKALGEKLTDEQTDNIIRFVLAQKIDPSNALHLIKLWNMFR
jgi:hypothetical protein